MSADTTFSEDAFSLPYSTLVQAFKTATALSVGKEHEIYRWLEHLGVSETDNAKHQLMDFMEDSFSTMENDDLMKLSKFIQVSIVYYSSANDHKQH
ncbi:hypothetical protein ACFL12_00815 [Pseudomonadota bacterium]